MAAAPVNDRTEQWVEDLSGGLANSGEFGGKPGAVSVHREDEDKRSISPLCIKSLYHDRQSTKSSTTSTASQRRKVAEMRLHCY